MRLTTKSTDRLIAASLLNLLAVSFYSAQAPLCIRNSAGGHEPLQPVALRQFSGPAGTGLLTVIRVSGIDRAARLLAFKPSARDTA
jgi:hypothetical protein